LGYLQQVICAEEIGDGPRGVIKPPKSSGSNVSEVIASEKKTTPGIANTAEVSEKKRGGNQKKATKKKRITWQETAGTTEEKRLIKRRVQGGGATGEESA